MYVCMYVCIYIYIFVCVYTNTHARTHAYRIMDTVRRSTLQNIILLFCLLEERCVLIAVHFIKPLCVCVCVCVCFVCVCVFVLPLQPGCCLSHHRNVFTIN